MRTFLAIAVCIFMGVTTQAQPKLIRVLGQLYGSNGNWADSSERLISYNSQGQSYEQIINNTNNTSSWMPEQREENTYNSSGQITGTDIFKWDISNTAWNTTPDITINYTYNPSSLLTLVELHHSGLTYKESFTYNTGGQLTERRSGNYKTLYSYNSSGQLTETLYQVFISPAWLNNYRKTHSYNSSGALVEVMFDYWDAPNNNWYAGKHFRDTYSYNTDGTLKEVLKEHYNDTAWVNFSRDLYYYTNTTGITKLNDDELFSVYPNPTAGEITITGAFDNANSVITLTDLSGRMLFSTNTFAENILKIDLSGLATGIYMLQMQTGNGVQTTKIKVE